MKTKAFLPLMALFLIMMLGCKNEPTNWVASENDSAVELRHRGTGLNGDCFNFRADFMDALGYFSIPGDYDIPVDEGWGAVPTSMTIGGVSGTMASIVTATIPNPRQADKGAVHYRLMHFFAADDGFSYFYTRDKAVCAPVEGSANPCRVNDQMTIVGGGGIYEGVSGKISTHGEILITGVDNNGIPVGTVTIELHGRVCTP